MKLRNVEIPDHLLTERDKQAVQYNEQAYLKQWKKLFKKNDVVYDIGAYIGLISINLALEGAIVHAFEPSIHNYTRLQQICKNFPQITLHPYALHTQEYKTTTQFNDCSKHHPKQEIQYVVLSKYQISNNLPLPQFIKIDIEGMESIILKDLFPHFNPHRPCWQIEWHKGIPHKYSDFPGFVNDYFDFEIFIQNHYNVYDKEMKPTRIDQFEIYENYFFVPKEKEKKLLL